MLTAMRRWLGFAMVLAGVACGGRATQTAETAPRAARSQTDRISHDEILRGHWANAYDLIENLRPRWLRDHGPNTILGDPVVVQVHLDENRMGGVDALRAISVSDIESIEWIDPVSAAARWGADHANGAILISTRSR